MVHRQLPAHDLTDYRKNESNHEIDLCQIYGRNIDATNLLRSFDGGRLKSQVIDGEEYPEFLFAATREPVSRSSSSPSSMGCSTRRSSPT